MNIEIIEVLNNYSEDNTIFISSMFITDYEGV
jgi:hypothetical protein